MAQNYRSLFSEGIGAAVLRDLVAKFNPSETPYLPAETRKGMGGPWEDPQAWAIYRLGQQSAVREILQAIEAGKGGD